MKRVAGHPKTRDRHSFLEQNSIFVYKRPQQVCHRQCGTIHFICCLVCVPAGLKILFTAFWPFFLRPRFKVDKMSQDILQSLCSGEPYLQTVTAGSQMWAEGIIFLPLHLNLQLSSLYHIIMILIIRHELCHDRSVSASSNSLFRGLPSRLRPFSL